MFGWLKFLGLLCIVIGLITAAIAISGLSGPGVDTSGLEQLCSEGNPYACQMAQDYGAGGSLFHWVLLGSGIGFAAVFGTIFIGMASIHDGIRVLLERTGPKAPLDLTDHVADTPRRSTRAEPRL